MFASEADMAEDPGFWIAIPPNIGYELSAYTRYVHGMDNVHMRIWIVQYSMRICNNIIVFEWKVSNFVCRFFLYSLSLAVFNDRNWNMTNMTTRSMCTMYMWRRLTDLKCRGQKWYLYVELCGSLVIDFWIQTFRHSKCCVRSNSQLCMFHQHGDIRQSWEERNNTAFLLKID